MERRRNENFTTATPTMICISVPLPRPPPTGYDRVSGFKLPRRPGRGVITLCERKSCTRRRAGILYRGATESRLASRMWLSCGSSLVVSGFPEKQKKTIQFYELFRVRLFDTNRENVICWIISGVNRNKTIFNR